MGCMFDLIGQRRTASTPEAQDHNHFKVCTVTIISVINCVDRQVKLKAPNPLPSRRSARLQERLSSYVETPDSSFSHHYSAPLGYTDEHVSSVLFVL